MDTFLYILEMFSAIAMVLGLIMAIMGVWFFTTKHRMKNCTVHTKGVLVKIHIGTRRHSADYMQFDYQVNGQTVRGTVTFEYIEDLSKHTPLGTTADIWYDPKRPTTFLVTKDPKNFQGADMFLKIGIAGIALLILGGIGVFVFFLKH
jgi:hypothetical protein